MGQMGLKFLAGQLVPSLAQAMARVVLPGWA
jgi:hypothetical protein